MVKMAGDNINLNQYNPTQPEYIYTIFDKFLNKTVIEKKSFITELEEDIFIVDNIKAIESVFVKNFDGTKDKLFKDKVTKQFGQTDDACKQIFSNLLYLRYLPIWEMKADAKVEKINPFELKLAQNPLNIVIDDVNKYFPCEAISSYSYSLQAIYEEMVELIFLFHYLLLDQSGTQDSLESIKSKIVSWVLNNKDCKKTFYIKVVEGLSNNNADTSDTIKKQIGEGKRNLAIDHMLLNLCYPEKYSRIATMSTKKKIVKALYEQYLGGVLENEKLDNVEFLDNNIMEITKKIKEKKGIDNIEDNLLTDILWRKDIRSEWEGGYVANAYEILTQYQKQVILYGAPGTGKTYSAEQIIKEFVCDAENNGKPKDIELKDYQYKDNYDWTQAGPDKEVELTDSLKKKNVIWEMVQFNQSYSYEDFIEGLRPTKNGGLKIVHGIFKRFATVAAQEKNKDKKFIFVIDEINRGKIDKIFGELLYLLEYRDKSLRLHYSNEEFSIPENVYIIGTMNTADKSIALLDVALRRRFWFVRCEPDRDVLFEEFGIDKNDKLEIGEEDKQENIKILAIKLFDWLNKQLDNLGNDADELKIGHSYFLKLIEDKDDKTIVEPTFSDLKNIGSIPLFR